MRGAKPKVDNVIPMRGDAPKPVPAAPDLMSERGKEVWDRLASEMVRKDRLEPHHEDLFAAYCEAVADVVELTSNIAMNGRTYTVKTRNGMQQKKTSDWQARQDALANMTRLGALFGMSPVDDQRLAGGGQGDLFDQLLREMRGGN
jgi:P27 family predicted phage terminase small subunit